MAAPLDRLRRALTLIPLLQENPGMRVREIGRYLGIPEDEVTDEVRDLVMMCGVPPYFPHNYIGFYLEGDRVYVRFAEHFRRPVRLTLTEALSLTMALRTLQGSAGNAFDPALDGLRRKIAEVLAPEDARSLRDAEQRIQSARGPGSAAARRLQDLRDAMRRSQSCRIRYYANHRGVMTERVIHPYGVVERDGDWFCIAHDTLRDAERVFRVDRIRSVEMLEDSYDVPDSFDAAERRAPEMFTKTGEAISVRIRFTPEIARFIRELSDPRELEELADGGVVRRLHSSSIEWIVKFVLRHAPHAEVLEPPEVRAAVAETSAAMLKGMKKRYPASPSKAAKAGDNGATRSKGRSRASKKKPPARKSGARQRRR
ncbi:MAG: helix-turn-helix transcriptional regulator [Planctomycetota bacterium]